MQLLTDWGLSMRPCTERQRGNASALAVGLAHPQSDSARGHPNTRLFVLMTCGALLLGCGASGGRAKDSDAYTLYRTSSLSPELRIRVATFDEPGDEAYNRNTCEEVRELEQASVVRSPSPPRYWCEKGYWRE